MNRITKGALCVAAAVVLAAQAPAQSLTFADFSDVSAFAFNASAAQSGNVLRVAPAGLLNKGSVYYSAPLAVVGGFDTTFTFRITNASSSGGSGLAFIIHNDPFSTTAIGDHAWAMGYAEFGNNPGAGLNESLVLEIDTFLDANQNDPSHSHVSLHTNGSGDNQANENFSLGSYNTPSDVSDGQPHTLRIVYVPGSLDVYYDGSATPVISAAYDFGSGGTWAAGGTVGGINLMGGTSALVGWSAAMPNTTSQLQDHDVLDWTWASLTPPTQVYPGNGADLDIGIEVNGSTSAGMGGVHTVNPTDLFGFTFSSPGGTLDGSPFSAAASVFTTGMPPAGVPAINVWVDPFAFVLLLDGFGAGPFLPTLSAGGFAYGPFPVPAGFAGTNTSVLVQMVTVAGGLGLSDGVELRFQ